MEASNDVLAVKNGMERKFTRRQWDIMGTDKYGWEVVPTVPKEVADKVAKLEGSPVLTNDHLAIEPIKRTRKSKDNG